MKRIVPVIVTDPDVTQIDYFERRPGDWDQTWHKQSVPVPEDDRLRRILDRVTGYAIEVAEDEVMADIDCGPIGLGINTGWREFIHDILRLRAAYGLDTEDET